MKSIIKLDDKIIEKFENSNGMLLIKGGTNAAGELVGNGLCFNKNCPSCQVQPEKDK